MPISEQNRKIIEFATANPCIFRADIARHYGISSERVRQILKNAGVRTRHYTEKKQRFCRCGNVITTKLASYCEDCRNIQLKCDYCGKMFPRHITDATRPAMQHKYTFCSNHCKGKWLGESKYKSLLPEIQNKIDSG